MFSTAAEFRSAFLAALRKGEVSPHLQPIIALRDGAIAGFEVLARWHDPLRGAISPGQFIPWASEAGLLGPLLESLMRGCFAAAGEWSSSCFLAFNVSAEQLREPDLPEQIDRLAAQHGFPLDRLHIEITETALIDDTAAAGAVLERLVRMGCPISMDDFGTGYSSLTWLRTLPFSKIKIDTSFTLTMGEAKESRKIVAAVVGLGQSLDLDVVAEGVETVAQAELLRRIGCPYAQGYLFGRPMPLAQVPGLLRDHVRVEFRTGLERMTLEQRAGQISALYRSRQTSIGFLTPDFRVVEASATFAERVGVPLADLIGMSVRDFAPGSDERIEWLHSFRGRGLPYPSFELALPGGRTDLVVLDRAEDEVGELLGYSVLGIDITDRRKAEEALRESEEYLRITAALSPRIAWQADNQGRLMRIDARHAEAIGLPIEELLDFRWMERLHPDDRDRTLADWQRCITTGGIHDNEGRFRMNDGAYRWVRAYVVPQKDAEGNVLRWFGQVEDIDARKRREIASEEAVRRLHAITESSVNLIWAAPPDGGVIEFGPRVGRLFAPFGTGLCRAGWREVAHPEHGAIAEERWRASLRDGTPYDIDFRLGLRGAEDLWVRVQGAPYRDRQGGIEIWHGTMILLAPHREPAGPRVSCPGLREVFAGHLAAAGPLEEAGPCRGGSPSWS
ncbi:MAG: hypothetical protein DI532_11355 [Azospirillum brasilense]|nr:MAG: hypothetical protein DI532_11355 [Azospirillum brasilense]